MSGHGVWRGTGGITERVPLLLAQAGRPLTVREIAAALAMNASSVSGRMGYLVDCGLVTRSGAGSRVDSYRYTLARNTGGADPPPEA